MQDAQPVDFDTSQLLSLSPNTRIREHLVDPGAYIWWLDTEGRIVSLSESAAQLVGAKVSDLLGKLDVEMFRTETLQSVRDVEASVLEKNTPAINNLVRQIPTKAFAGGNTNTRTAYWLISVVPWYDCDSDANPCGVVRIARDATDAVTATANSFDETYSQLIAEVSRHSLPDVYDTRIETPLFEYTHDLKGMFVSMNDFGLKTFGLSIATLSDCNITEILSERHHKHLRKSIDKEFADLKPRLPIIWRARSNDGTPMWIEIRAERKTTADGEVIYGRGWPISLSSLHELHRHSRVIQGGRIAAWDRDLSSNRFFVSAEWKRLLGIPSTEQITFLEFVNRLHPNDRVRVRKDFSDHQAEHREYYDTRYQILHNDGTYRWMHAIGKITTGAGGTSYISGHNIDITGEMQEASALSESEALLRAIVDADPAMIFMKNSARKFVYVNRSLCDWYKTTPENAIGKNDEWFFRNVQRTQLIEDQLTFFADCDTATLKRPKGEPYEVLERIVPPGGSEVDARWFSTVKIRVDMDRDSFVVGVSSDVTRLYLEKDLWKSLLEVAPAAMFIKNSDGAYENVNRRFAALIGAASVEAVEQKRASDFLQESSADSTEASDRECLDGAIEDALQREISTKNGERKLVLGSKRAVRVLDEFGNFSTKLVGCDVDQSEARDQSYVELLDSLLTTLKHDYVYRFLSTIETEMEEHGEGKIKAEQLSRWKRMLRYSQDFIKRLQWLTPRVDDGDMTFESGNFEEAVCLLDVINEACELANMLEKYPVCRAVDLDPKLCVPCDRTLAANVVFNFLHNAKKFTPGRAKKKNDVVVRAGLADDGKIRVSVDDGGEGLKDGVDPWLLFEKGKAFDPSSRSVKGSGIGLFFNRIMIEQMLHGQVEEPSKSDRSGAVFSFVLPRCKSDTANGEIL